jgi:hypothetical protein
MLIIIRAADVVVEAGVVVVVEGGTVSQEVGASVGKTIRLYEGGWWANHEAL